LAEGGERSFHLLRRRGGREGRELFYLKEEGAHRCLDKKERKKKEEDKRAST